MHESSRRAELVRNRSGQPGRRVCGREGALHGTESGYAASLPRGISKQHGQSGAAFDRAYIDHEVAYHQQVLDAINNTLIPNAQNAELKALLQQTAPAIEAHLQHAKELQTPLGQS